MLYLLIRPICLIFTLWLVLSTALTVLARGQPSGDYDMAKYGFAVCALPCWAGITPGETSLETMMPLMRANIPALKSLREYSPGNIYFEMGQTTSIIVHGRGSFQSISLSLSRVPLVFLLERI